MDENLIILKGGTGQRGACSCFIGLCSLKAPFHQTLCPLKAEKRWRPFFPASSVHALLGPFSWVLGPGWLWETPPVSPRTGLQLLSAQLYCAKEPRDSGNIWNRVGSLNYRSGTHFPASQLFPVLTLSFSSWLTLPDPCCSWGHRGAARELSAPML